MTTKTSRPNSDVAKRPGLDEERALLKQGYRLIAGLDEAGRGAWAGPVHAAAVQRDRDREWIGPHAAAQGELRF